MRLFFFTISTFLTMNLQAQTLEQSNQHFWNTIETFATPETIWKIWTDVPNWKDWDKELKSAELDGLFAKGVKGKLIPQKGKKAKFKIVAFEKGKSYTFKTNLPLGSLFVKRTLEVKNGRTYFTHEVWFKGLTKGIFAKLLGNDFRKALPIVMENIKKIAEKN